MIKKGYNVSKDKVGGNNRRTVMKSVRKKGFSLIEIVVVMVILGILAAIFIPSMIGYIDNSKRKKCQIQRLDMATYFKAAYAYDKELSKCADMLEIDQYLKSSGYDSLVEYMQANKYCEEEETVCPVYGEKYGYQFSLNGYNMSIAFTCPCEDSFIGYVNLAKKVAEDFIKDKKPAYSREELIKKVYEENGGLLKVNKSYTDSMSGVSDKDKNNMYWRPYTLKKNNQTDGVVLYASVGDNSSHSTWTAYALYYNGNVYYPSSGKNKGVASLRNESADSMDSYLSTNGWVKK